VDEISQLDVKRRELLQEEESLRSQRNQMTQQIALAKKEGRDTEAIQIKLDELIYALKGPNAALLDLEELDEKTLDKIREAYVKRATEARRELGCENSPEEEAKMSHRGG